MAGTIKEIAEKAGVSRGTVDRIIAAESILRLLKKLKQ